MRLLRSPLIPHVLEAVDESVAELGAIEGVQVVGAKVTVFDAVSDDLVDGGEHGGGDRDDVFLGSATCSDTGPPGPPHSSESAR